MARQAGGTEIRSFKVDPGEVATHHNRSVSIGVNQWLKKAPNSNAKRQLPPINAPGHPGLCSGRRTSLLFLGARHEAGEAVHYRPVAQEINKVLIE
jgi:hypothetical protein